MAHAAASALAEPAEVGVLLTIPRGGMPRGFPRGELLNEVKRGGVVERTYSFPPRKVIGWLVANGLVSMDLRDGRLVFGELTQQPSGGQGDGRFAADPPRELL